jgi:hypothetical protein
MPALHDQVASGSIHGVGVLVSGVRTFIMPEMAAHPRLCACNIKPISPSPTVLQGNYSASMSALQKAYFIAEKLCKSVQISAIFAYFLGGNSRFSAVLHRG